MSHKYYVHKNKQSQKKIKKAFLILQHSTLKSTVVQYSSWHTGAGIEGTGRKSYWRRERRLEVAELKDCLQWETEGKLQFQSSMSDIDGTYVSIFKSSQLEGLFVRDLLYRCYRCLY